MYVCVCIYVSVVCMNVFVNVCVCCIYECVCECVCMCVCLSVRKHWPSLAVDQASAEAASVDFCSLLRNISGSQRI